MGVVILNMTDLNTGKDHTRDQDINTYTDQIRIITDDVYTDALRIDNAIKYIDNQFIEVEAMKGKDPHYIIGWLKQSLRIVKETLSPN